MDYRSNKKNVCCLSNQPTSGEGGSPIYFAGRHERSNNQNGYIVVISLPPEVYNEKMITILDNKVLDDYVRYHFFIREEFRSVGYNLFKVLNKVEPQSINDFVRTNLKPSKNNILYNNQDKIYFKHIPELNQHEFFSLQNIDISNTLISVVEHFGSWEVFYSFLTTHFGHVKEEEYLKLIKKNYYDHNNFWNTFYEYFPCNIKNPRQEHMNLWFSFKWLQQRQLSIARDNSQILVSPIEPEYIVGFIHITNSSGVVPRFRPIKRAHKTQAKYTLAKRIWREVYRMIDKL